jgi:hypothetical protein
MIGRDHLSGRLTAFDPKKNHEIYGRNTETFILYLKKKKRALCLRYKDQTEKVLSSGNISDRVLRSSILAQDSEYPDPDFPGFPSARLDKCPNNALK